MCADLELGEIRKALGGRLGQLINNATQEHCLALARITLDPEQSALGVLEPLYKFVVVET